jgi:hypothetical protein
MFPKLGPEYGELLASLISGAAAQPISGLAGIAGTMVPKSLGGYPGQGADWVKSTQDALTYQPRGEVAQRGARALGKVGEVWDAAKHAYADPIAENTGPWGPLLGSAAFAAPEALLAALGMRGTGPATLGDLAAAGSPRTQTGIISAKGLNKAGKAKAIEASTGRVVGAPKGVKGLPDVDRQAAEYADRIDEALNNGVPRGYFYERGTEANRAVTGSESDLDKLALLEGITSSEAPVHTNTGWAIKGMEQNAMGVPVKTGKYPNANQAKAEAALAGDLSHIGEKTHRYSAGLTGDVQGLAPNDRWEIRSFGYDKDTATPQQHAYMDEVRQKAVDKWNADHPDSPPLTALEGQELNWATQRARDMKIPHAQAAEDTIQDALEAHTIQHSWESAGGEKAGHLRDITPEEAQAYHDQVTGAIIDPATGKDRIISGMGGALQYPAFNAPGIWEGVVSPGTQSQSLGAITQAHGLDPTTMARVRGTEAVRAYALGQDAYSAHGIATPKSISGPGTSVFDVDLGRPITLGEFSQANDIIGKHYEGAAGIIPSERGFHLMRFDDNPQFGKQVKEGVLPDLKQQFPDVKATAGSAKSAYHEMSWGEPGGATRDLLVDLQDPELVSPLPGHAAPKLMERADSPEIHGVLDSISQIIDEQVAAGKTPNPKLKAALDAWTSGGIPALRDLMKAGGAPAVGFAYSQTPSPSDQ